jgi:hypothetical protein
MLSKPAFLVVLLYSTLLALPALDEETSLTVPDSAVSDQHDESKHETVEQAPEKAPTRAPNSGALAFETAEIGLPGLPQPMTSTEDFRTTLDLIDVRLADQEMTLAAAAEAEIDEDGARDAGLDSNGLGATGGADAAPGDTAIDPIEATAATIEKRIQLLRELRIAVQRRATLRGRLETTEADLAKTRQQLETIQRNGVALEPPSPISLLDQLQAEFALKQALEDVAETRVETAARRVSAAEKALSSAVRERRTVRDQLAIAESDGAADADLAGLEQDLELTRLSELLARQRLAAGEAAVELARNEDRLVEAQQALLSARIAFLDPRVELPREALDQRLSELTAAEAEFAAQIEALQPAAVWRPGGVGIV